MSRFESTAPILVLGGTGFLGRHIVRSLLEHRVPVRVLSRDAARALEVLGPDVRVIEGDITTGSGLSEACRGARGMVISVSSMTRELFARTREIEHDGVLETFEQARRACVRRVVYLSAYDLRMELLESLGLNLVVARIKHAIEAILACSDFNWTVLGVAPSTDIFREMIRGKRMIVPGGGPPLLPTVSPLDVGEIAAQSVLRDDLGGKRLRITGPDALSFGEALERINQATGETRRLARVPLVLPRLGATLAAPFAPFVREMVGYLVLMNNFPQDLAERTPELHKRLLDIFDYAPSCLEDDIARW